MRTISLRPETLEDEVFLRTLYASTRSEEMALVPWSDTDKAAFLNQQFDLQRLHYQTHYPTSDFLVIEVEGQRAGRWYLYRGEDYFALIEISLLPNYRDLGIGTDLLQGLQAEANFAHKAIRLHVIKNSPAYHLYTRLGFQVLEDRGIRWYLEWQPARV
jgi:ribosomal protein S18 acetylase RimI-like enzyme